MKIAYCCAALALLKCLFAAPAHCAEAYVYDNELAPTVYPTGKPEGALPDNVVELMGIKQFTLDGETIKLPEMPISTQEMVDLAESAKENAREYDRKNHQWMMDNAVNLGKETVAEILERKNIAEVTGWDDMVEYARQWVEKYREAMPGPGNRLEGNPVLYLFISSSMPMDTLIAYSRSMEAIPGSVLFVMRGLIGGMTYIKPTIEFFKALYPDAKQGDEIPAGMFIDPNLFKKYRIERVPALVFDPSAIPGRLMSSEQITAAVKENKRIDDNWNTPKNDNEFYVVYGDVSVAYAAELINREAKSPYLAELVTRLENSGFFSDKESMPSEQTQIGGKP